MVRLNLTRKILHIIDQHRIGGPGKTILKSAKYIQSDRYLIHIAAFRERKSGLNEILDHARAVGVPCLELDDVRGFNLRQICQLRAYIQKHRIDILHTHGYKTNILGVFVKLFCPAIRLVSTYHGWIGNTLRQQMYIAFDSFISRFHDGVITVSREIYDRLPKFGRRQKQIIHNAIVISDYQPQERRQNVREMIGIGRSDSLIGVFGRLSLEKGCLQMLSALHILRSNRKDIKLLIIGEGPLEETLSEEIERLNLSDAVIRLTYQKHIQKYFEALDLYVSPSLTEGISNVILEAMAFKIPVIATRVGGTPEIIRHKHDGILVPAGSPQALAMAIGLLLDNPELRSRLSQNGCSTISKRFSFHKRMEKVCHFYDTLFR